MLKSGACSDLLVVGQKRTYATKEEEFDEDFSFDASASLQKEFRQQTRKTLSAEEFVMSILPKNPPDAAIMKLQKYFKQYPVNNTITADQVLITHIWDPVTEKEEKVSIPTMDVEEALAKAAELKLDIVQLGLRDGVAFCRIRDETQKALSTVADLLAVEDAPTQDDGGKASNWKMQSKTMNHQFKDVADAHFVKWKSVKIVEELGKGYPVKLQIQQFVSVESAVAKMKEMAEAIRLNAVKRSIPFNGTQVQVSEREINLQLTPTDPAKKGADGKPIVKTPSDKDWQRNMDRFREARGGSAGNMKKAEYRKYEHQGKRYALSKDGKGFVSISKDQQKTLDTQLISKHQNRNQE